MKNFSKSSNFNPKKSIVILGSGFAALNLVKNLNLVPYKVFIVSPRNHFLFTPLLPSTAVGTIEFRSIIEPIRTARKGLYYYQANAVSLSREKNSILCTMVDSQSSFELDFDYLVITVGSINNTFGIPGVEENALFLKELRDARSIRAKITDIFERAGSPGISNESRDELLHFVIVGGGPTGVEFAAELHDFIHEDLVKWYPTLVDYSRITILEAADQILGTFNSHLSEYTIKHFLKSGIDVKTHSTVKEVRRHTILLKDESTVPYGLLVWSTGIGPTNFVCSLDCEKNHASRILTDNFMRIPDRENIFAVGDCATPKDIDYPATAQCAQQQGKYIARYFNKIAKDKATKPFKYHDLGMLAYIGGRHALADLPNVKGKGFTGFLFWRSAYLTRLVSLKNKILVLFDWLKTSIFGRDISNF